MTAVPRGLPFPLRCVIIALFCLSCRDSDTSPKSSRDGDVEAVREPVGTSTSLVIILMRDVRVVDRGAAPEERGVLYGDTSLVLPRGTELTMIRIGLEGGCTVRRGALMLSLTSCPWLDGFPDHQSDIFLRRDMPAVAR